MRTFHGYSVLCTLKCLQQSWANISENPSVSFLFSLFFLSFCFYSGVLCFVFASSYLLKRLAEGINSYAMLGFRVIDGSVRNVNYGLSNCFEWQMIRLIERAMTLDRDTKHKFGRWYKYTCKIKMRFVVFLTLKQRFIFVLSLSLLVYIMEFYFVISLFSKTNAKSRFYNLTKF